jgi:hypothetical protein
MASGSVAPSFFVDHKRGEVNELKMLLNNPKLLRELDKKREVIKKVSRSGTDRMETTSVHGATRASGRMHHIALRRRTRTLQTC